MNMDDGLPVSSSENKFYQDRQDLKNQFEVVMKKVTERMDDADTERWEHLLTYMFYFVVDPSYDTLTIKEAFESEMDFLTSQHADKALLRVEAKEIVAQFRDITMAFRQSNA